MNLPMSCLAATLAAMRFAYDKSDSNFNNVGVRSFILYGAPLPKSHLEFIALSAKWSELRYGLFGRQLTKSPNGTGNGPARMAQSLPLMAI
jgi:hypothetical protein